MEPLSLAHGTQVRTFSVEDDGCTIVITTTDSSQPDRPPHQGWEVCESEAEAEGVLRKLVHDLERQGWQPVG
ncbi:hypothetical protein [Demequina rhizosphaerae]|uniref:hypothetical protein n=1 Tax=Demequina rhizosphaerae TaxID=1638985 RepID=UPI000782C2AF|nr:hypothetical protein [Demequina rhizosphaerae]